MPPWHDFGAGVAGRLLLGSGCVSLAARQLPAVSDTRFCQRGLTAEAAESSRESARLVIEKSSPGRRSGTCQPFGLCDTFEFHTFYHNRETEILCMCV